MITPGRPQAGEHAPYFSRYIDLVPEDDVVGTLEAQGREIAALLAPLGEEKASFRYAPDKWSVKQVVGHISDAERVFAYRLLSIARGETQSLPGFDEKEYMQHANFDQRPFAELLDDFDATRRATLTLLRGLADDAWTRSGTANATQISVRAIAYTLVGHARHHLGVLRSRYL
jgi:uncharacterized damage-inducible protein DinB